MTGQFITVEGIEGAGKTTQLAHLQSILTTAGKTVRLTREPGGTALGEAVRQWLLDHRQEGVGAEAELLLLFAARAEHLRQVIRPALAAGTWVVCDRFTDASYAYQGGGRGITRTRIALLEEWIQGDLRPALTLLFDLPVAAGLARVGQRGPANRFEQENAAFHQRVRDAYLARAATAPDRYRIIAADRDAAAVSAAVTDALQPLLV
jgi:dTMP kinase